MINYLQFLYETLKNFFGGIWDAIKGFILGIYKTINLNNYFNILNEYKNGFNILAWILSIITITILIIVFIFILILIYLLIKKIVIMIKNEKQHTILINKLNNLKKEKELLLNINPKKSETIEQNKTFIKLNNIDKKYISYDESKIIYDDNYTLSELCQRFRNFACGNLSLYYDIKTIRLFISALATSKLIILQGISGTGKTSLPYAFSKFINNDALIACVQPSWKDRTELFGYYNEFTKSFNETEVLSKLYEAQYTKDIYITILDEINISRVEYYFAEMLSYLEIPSSEKRLIDLMPESTKSDPKLLINGKLQIPNNMWYIGTANNDDTTFLISDKVYDRSIVIDLDKKGNKFNCEKENQIKINYQNLNKKFDFAKANNQISNEYLLKIKELDKYMIDKFNISFGNRIQKQLETFVPVFVACGGSQIDAIDYIIKTKILKKIENLNKAYIKEELKELIKQIDLIFGKDNLKESLIYLKHL